MSSGTNMDTMDLGFNLDTSKDKSFDDLRGGGGVTKTGWYHVLCTGVEKVVKSKDGKATTPHISLTLEVLNGDHSDQIGKKTWFQMYLMKAVRDSEGKATGDYDPLDDRGIDGIKVVLHAFGLLKESDLGKDNVPVNFGAIQDKQAVAQFEEEEYDEKKDGKPTGKKKKTVKIRWPSSFFHPLHEKVRDVKKDADYMATLGGPAPSSPQAQANAQATVDSLIG